MKTTKFLLALFLFVSNFAIAQWQLTGNSNTTTSSFFGTTASAPSNAQDIIFKRAAVNAGLLSATKTSYGVNSLAMPNSVSFGVSAGQFSSGSGSNTYIGQMAGKGQSASILNTGTNNTFIGYSVGSSNTSGNHNVYLGSSSGRDATTGNYNVYLGVSSGMDNSTGSNNVFIGTEAGLEVYGSNNIFIGSKSGPGNFDTVNNQLYINGSTNYSEIPLIWGDFSADQLKLNGKVGIGGDSTTGFGSYPTTAGGVNVSAYKLFVKGGILTEEVRVSLASTWADYVFNKDYNLKPLSEVESFIKENGHLPNVPSAAQVKEEGIALGEMAKIQQEKIEELTLYLIEQKKRNDGLNAILNKQGKEIEELKAQMKILLEKN